jgi:hypothetical protein
MVRTSKKVAKKASKLLLNSMEVPAGFSIVPIIDLL